MDIQAIKDRILVDEQAQAATLPEQKLVMPRQLRDQIEEFNIASENLNQVKQEVNLIPIAPAALSKMEEQANKKMEQEKAALPDVPVQGFTDPSLQDAVKAKCEPMDFADLVITGRVTQLVPVLPKKLQVEFQSLTGTESFWINSYIADKPETQRFGWSFYLRLAMSIKSINNLLWEPHITSNKVDEKAVLAKLEKLLKMSEQVLHLIGINQRWFSVRVEELFNDDLSALKNG